MRMNDLIILV